MNFDEFREFSIASIEFIIKYLGGVRERDVLPFTAPRSIIHSLPKELPEQPEHWKNILMDLEDIILPGLTHWQSPNFHAFFPSATSAGSIVGELLIAGIGVLGFSWGLALLTSQIDMDAKTFREFGKAAVDFVADYMENIRECEVLPSVKPGYLFNLLPEELPETSEDWRVILQDISKYIKPGITHWQSPNFHAFYPTACSYPSIVGEMLAAGFSVIGFNWICSPACTELEVVVMDWLAKFLKLPPQFLHSADGHGGGIIQGSASEAVLVAVIAAREQAVRHFRLKHPEMSESDIRGRLIAYSSDQSNSCIEKAGVLAAMPVKLLPADQNFVLHGKVLKEAVMEDVAKGFLPVICIATLGTTGTCSYDDIESLAPICQQHNIWLHVDAAYAGAAFALEECEHLRRGLNEVDSLNFNLHKFLMVNFDCCAMWLKDARKVVDSFNVDRIYLKHEHEGESQMPDFRHWQIPLGRRFRALKVWITFRSIGAVGLRAHVRKHIALAERFEQLVLADKRLEIISKRTLGLVCFRAIGDNRRTTALLQRITDRKKLYMVQASHRGKHFLRFVVCGMDPKENDIDFAWSEIESQLTEVLRAESLMRAAQQDSIFDADSITGKGEITISQELSSGLHIGASATEKSK